MFFCQKCRYFCMDKRLQWKSFCRGAAAAKDCNGKRGPDRKFSRGIAWANFLSGWPKKKIPVKTGNFSFFATMFLRMQIARVGVTFFTIGSPHFPPFIGGLLNQSYGFAFGGFADYCSIRGWFLTNIQVGRFRIHR